MTQISDTLLYLQDVSKRFGKKTARKLIRIWLCVSLLYRPDAH